MHQLIADLEAAAVGSRKLDRTIYWSLGFPFPRTGDMEKVIPLYTTSLDAALTLVPEEFVWQVKTDFGPIAWAALSGHQGIFWGDTKSEALTPALAVCIASLRARQAMAEAA